MHKQTILTPRDEQLNLLRLLQTPTKSVRYWGPLGRRQKATLALLTEEGVELVQWGRGYRVLRPTGQGASIPPGLVRSLQARRLLAETIVPTGHTVLELSKVGLLVYEFMIQEGVE